MSSSPLQDIAIIGRPVREGTPSELGRPTPEVIIELSGSDSFGAGEVFEYWASHELTAVVRVYRNWVPSIIQWLVDQAADVNQCSRVALEAAALTCQFDIDLDVAAALLTQASSEPGTLEQCLGLHTFERESLRLQAAARITLADSGTIGTGQLKERLDALTAHYRRLHDRAVALTWGLFAAAKLACGEEAVGDLLRASVTGPMVTGRTTYAQLAQLSARQIADLTAETMRSHFSGRDRSGQIDYVEEDDRFVLSFDPCGSGGA